MQRRRIRIATLAALLLGAAALTAAPAGALTLGFGCITGNLAGDCAIGEGQLGVEITDPGGGAVRFQVRNAGPEASAVAEIYFDDGSLLGLSSVHDGPGVDFEPAASPPDLPGGDGLVPPFQVTAGFLAQASSPPSMNGVGPGQWVQIDFDLQAGRSVADVAADLASGELRIGLHVIGFASGGSESFVNLAAVPEPALGLLGAGALVALRVRRRRTYV